MTTLQPRASTRHPRSHILRSQTDLPQKSVRPSVARPQTYDKDCAGAGPWQHMAQTYAWVVEQEFVRLEKRSKKTEQWVLEQQILLMDGTRRQRSDNGAPRRKMWEEMVYVYEVEAEKWMLHEEEARRMAAEREKEKARLIQEEIKRIEARIRNKRDAEKRKMVEEKLRVYAEHKDREKGRAKAEKAVVDAWRNYEDQWATLATSSEPLTFTEIPWPLISPPSSATNITSAGVVLFLFSPFHSQNLSRKDRIRSAQLRWHPDRFRRLMGRVAQQDRAAVEEGVGAVARCLNDLMARETNASRYVRPIHFYVSGCR